MLKTSITRLISEAKFTIIIETVKIAIFIFEIETFSLGV